MGARVVETRTGPMLIPPHDSYVGRALQENGVFSPDEFQGWLPYLPRGGVVLDIGANVGGHTFAFADAVGPLGTVIAVEPQRMLFAMLSGSQAMHGAKQVWPRWCAIGAEVGVAFIPELDYDAPNNFGGLSLRSAGEPVAKVPLDLWDMPAVDFIKIDVEGMELDVLKGAEQTIRRCRPVLCVEADRNEQYAALLGWGMDHGYTLYLQTPRLGAQWPSVRSKNLLMLPTERGLPEPTGPDIRRMTELDPPVVT
jgi:FkbM family methyltransferase